MYTNIGIIEIRMARRCTTNSDLHRRFDSPPFPSDPRLELPQVRENGDPNEATCGYKNSPSDCFLDQVQSPFSAWEECKGCLHELRRILNNLPATKNLPYACVLPVQALGIAGER